MRTFIAVPLPRECQAMLDQIQNNLRQCDAEVRWTAVSSIHLTLKFLGEIEPDRLRLFKNALEDAGGEPAFDLRVHGLGGFPNLRNPRVIWCSVTGEIEKLTRLQAKVEKACIGLGFAPEERSFQPHLTLGRVQGKRNLQPLADYIRIGSELECPFRVSHFNVYQSVLTPRGPIYTVLEKFNLK